MKLSIIIPVFNEEKTILSTLKNVAKVSLPKFSKEILIVDDGSTDATASIISNFLHAKASHRRGDKYQISDIRLLKHEKNQGKGGAIQTGIKHATGDYIIIQDADSEYDPKYIPHLLQPIILGKAQVVYGTRLKRMPHIKQEEKTFRFLMHYLGNRLLSFITSILYGQWITDMETGYKVFPKVFFTKNYIKSYGFDFEPEITVRFLKAKIKIVEVPITTFPRTNKEGKKLRTFYDGTRALWTLLKYRFMD